MLKGLPPERIGGICGIGGICRPPVRKHLPATVVEREGCTWEGCTWEGCTWEGCTWEGCTWAINTMIWTRFVIRITITITIIMIIGTIKVTSITILK